MSYHPPSYTAPKILKMPSYADKEEDHAALPYNEFDEERNVDRSSYVGKYDVVDGLPRSVMLTLQSIWFLINKDSR